MKKDRRSCMNRPERSLIHVMENIKCGSGRGQRKDRAHIHRLLDNWAGRAIGCTRRRILLFLGCAARML